MLVKIVSWKNGISKKHLTPTEGISTWALFKKKNVVTSHCTGWLLGILIMVYHNPYITVYHLGNPVNNLGSIISYIPQPTKNVFIAHL